MPSTAEVAAAYHQLAAKKTKLAAQLTLVIQRNYLQWKIPLIGRRFHWNAIWHHRMAIEIACQMKEGKDWATYLDQLEEYHKQYSQLYSTMPLCSNKSVSHYVGQCALDALLNKVNEKNIVTLAAAFNRIVKDGAFTEGGHYSKYVTDCFDRTDKLFAEWYGTHPNGVLRQSYLDISNSLRKVKEWQQRISDSDGYMAVLGDGWHEAVEPTDEQGVFYYSDMTIHRQDGWLAIKNHRQNKFSLHQHPHCDEILIAHNNDWLIKGSGMPSYKHVMRNPLKWRRPRNHFFTESRLDYWSILRFRKRWSRDMANNRVVEIDGSTLTIQDTSKKVIRFPGVRADIAERGKQEYNKFEWRYGKFTFVVEGINIKLLGADTAHAATTYGNETDIPVVRVKGENVTTRITVNDK